MNVVLGPSTHAMVEDRLATIDLDFIQVKGKTSGTYIYALMGDADLKATPEFINIQDKIHHFMEVYRSQKFDEALELLKHRGGFHVALARPQCQRRHKWF